MTDRFTRSEKSTKHFVKSQFPDFFLDEGEGIVNFVDQYYRHFSANTGNQIRDLQFQGDIDTTSDTNLIRFNNKYTFGSGRFIKELPAVITGDLRFIIKHIKDLYRSKGTIRGTKLFFRLSFNDSPEIFIPGKFLFSPSDSSFNRPDIVEIEVNGRSFGDAVSLEGKEVLGSISGSSAIVKSVFRKKIDSKELIYIELDNVSGSFVTGDKIYESGADTIDILISPKVIGPIDDLIVENGSTNIPLGTVFKALPTPSGTELKASATELSKILGTFRLRGVTGYGYSNQSRVIVTRAPGESNQIDRGVFSVVVDNIHSTHNICGDRIKFASNLQIGNCVINQTTLDSTDVNNAFSQTAISDILSYESRSYGTISRIDVNEEPKNYNGVSSPFIAIKDIVFTANQTGNSTITDTLLVATDPIFSNNLIQIANTLSGNASVIAGNNKVVGTGTSFTSDFNDFDVIKIMNDDGLPTFHNISKVESDTSITLMQDSPFTLSNNDYTRGFVNFIKVTDSNDKVAVRAVNNYVNSTAVYLDDKILGDELTSNPSYTINIGYSTSNVNFSPLNDTLKSKVKSGVTFSDVDTGVNANFNYKVSSATGSVSTLNILHAGFGYNPGEEIFLRSEDLTPTINIIDSEGSGNGAEAVAVLNDGKITSVLVLRGGAGYISPTVTATGGTGSGATFTSTVTNGVITSIDVSNEGTDYFSTQDITVKVNKGGQSFIEGIHTSRTSHLSSVNRIQDSNFWQEYSYEIKSTIDREKYEEVVDNLIHMSGRKFFTKNLIKDSAESSLKILEESVTATGT